MNYEKQTLRYRQKTPFLHSHEDPIKQRLANSKWKDLFVLLLSHMTLQGNVTFWKKKCAPSELSRERNPSSNHSTSRNGNKPSTTVFCQNLYRSANKRRAKQSHTKKRNLQFYKFNEGGTVV